MKTSKFFKFIKKKQKGQGDLIASLFVVLALTLFVFFFINVIADVNTRIQMDQIARKYILRMETEGYLTDEEAAAMKTELCSIPSVGAVATESDIDLTGTTMGSPKGYGATIILDIKCPATTTKYTSPQQDDGSIVVEQSSVGSIKRDDTTIKVYRITKSSTAKY